VVYEFKLKDAINTINSYTGETYLTPYRYIPKFISLNTEEIEEYISKTRAIVMKFNKIKNDEDKDVFLESLLFRRADIIKNAENKYKALEELLDVISSTIRWTIIYCNPQQIDVVMKIINKRGIISHRFTMEEGTVPDKKYGNISEREFLLQKFAENKYQVLIAMKCLDEGVDIPPARKAILMASSGNPREYIQRIGRVIRRYPGKEEAIIYDIIVVPSFNKLVPEFRAIEWNIFKKEIERYEYIAMNSINNAEALELIYNIKDTIMGR
jgi:superfamily II DNA or RNA helicase